MPARSEWLERDAFIARLGIIDDQGKRHRLNNPWPEQAAMLEALKTHHRIYVLKCRQVGLTTIVTGFNFWKGYTSPDPRSFLLIGHTQKSQKRVNRMLKEYWKSMPKPLRCSLPRSNTEAHELGHNGVVYDQIVAGGRASDRGDTYTDVHATEGGFWPKSTSATRGGEADRTLWASTMSTVHARDAHIIWESTADGPFGLNYELYRRAIKPESDWHFLFFPWHEVDRYRRVVHEPERFLDTVSDEERQLIERWDLDLEQIAFRRYKLEEDQFTPMRFRKEYPFHHLEPFLTSGIGWFDAEAILELASRVPTYQANDNSILQTFEKYEPWREYFIGQDTSGGVRKDYAVIQVLRDDMVQCAKWRSNVHSPRQQAEEGNKISSTYGGAPILVELNNHGKAVIHRHEELGTNLWTDDEGKYFWSQGGRAGNSKKEMYDFARHLINGLYATFNSSNTLAEASAIVEKPNGKIECEGESDDDHDDDIDGWCLAAWCARRYWSGSGKVRSKSRFEQLQARAKDPFNIRRRQA